MQLAAAGARRFMTERIPFAKPWLGRAEIAALGRPIAGGWITQGPEVAAFEREFAAAVGAPYACAVASGTVALELALEALGIGAGDEVITVSHSFIATANAIRLRGATPVFVDIDPRTFNLDPAGLEAAITPRTRAILCVHQLGMPCDLPAILAIARARGLQVVEDAACAVGSQIRIGRRWEPIGRPRGAAACFSFHPRKVITTGEGGLIATRDAALDRRLRLLRHQGMSVSDRERHESATVVFEEYVLAGRNGRLTDLQAALGRAQLRRLPVILERRRRLADRYREGLAALPGFIAPAEPAWAQSNWQSYCVYLPADLDQRAVLQFLADRGIAARRGVMCAHREPAYPAGTWSSGDLKNGETASDRAILLPLYPQMTAREQKIVLAALREAGRVLR